MTERLTDAQLVHEEIRAAADEDRPLSEVGARIIASWWHGGQSSPMYSFVSTGAIRRAELESEIYRDMAEARPLDRFGLWWLLDHVRRADGVDDDGNRPPVENWHEQTKWGAD